MNKGDLIQNKQQIRAYIRKKICWYVLPNLVFNSFIPYFSFENPTAVHLFKGEYCFARFILPMALFIPFAITVDFAKKITTYVSAFDTGTVWNQTGIQMGRLLKIGIFNGIITAMAMSLLLLIIWWSAPIGYTFSGFMLALFNGIFASLLAVYFTWWTIGYINKQQIVE